MQSLGSQKRTYRRYKVAFAFSVRRNLFPALSWGSVCFALVAATGSLYRRTYPDEAGRKLLAQTLSQNTALTALLGTPHRLDDVAGFLMWRASLGIALVVAIWAMLAATKALRGDEETGRWELLLARPIRSWELTGASLLGISACLGLVFLALLMGMVVAIPSSSFRISDAVAFAASHALFGMVFAGVGGVCSQLFGSRRAANIASGSFLVAAIVWRAVFSSVRNYKALAWLSPTGWLDHANPYSGNGVLGLAVLASASAWLFVTALWLSGQRDCGRAIFRGGDTGRLTGALLGYLPADAARFSLPSFLGWLIAASALSASFGAMAPTLVRTMRESEAFERFRGYIPFELIDMEGLLGLLLQFVAGIVVSLLAVSLVSGWRDEESSGRLDLVLANPVGRRAWLWSRAGVGLAEATLVALGAGIALWAAQAAFGGSVGLGPISKASVSLLPLAVFFGGLGVLLLGVWPRLASGLSWSAVAVSFFVYWMGSFFRISPWLIAVSPFYHLSPALGQPVNLVSCGVISAIGLGMAVAGIEAFARRDLSA
jgi:ABC-2 type transport system permease protein